jgi:hypothetical protein
VHGQAYIPGMSEMSMNTPNMKKRKKLKIKEPTVKNEKIKELFLYKYENGA